MADFFHSSLVLLVADLGCNDLLLSVATKYCFLM